MKDINSVSYKNLQTEMKNKQISLEQLAEGSGIAYDILKDKLFKKRIDLEEAEYIKHTFFPEFNTIYLFEESLT